MNNLFLYSFISNHSKEWDNGIIWIFSLILLYFSSKDSYNNLENILDKIKTELEIQIPNYVANTLQKKLRKDWYIDYKSYDKYNLTDKWNRKKKDIEIDIKWLNNKTIDNIEKDLKNIGIKESFKQIINIFSNSKITQINFLLWNWHQDNWINDNLIKFFKYIKQLNSNSYEYSFITSALYSILLSKILLKKDFLKDSSLKDLNIYLDSNVIISLLWFHNELFNTSIKELVDLLKKYWCNIKVFDITIDQIIKLFNNYDPSKYISEIPIDSVFYYMKLQGKTETDINLITTNIEEILYNQWINIDYYYNLNWLNNVKKKVYFDNDLTSLLEFKNKTDIDFWLEHDIGIYYAIKDLREKNRIYRVKFLEKSYSIFLTSDSYLCKWTSKKYKDMDSQYIPETIFAPNLTTYLRFKEPSINQNILFDQFIIDSYRSEVISRRLRDKFLLELRDQINSWKLSENDCQKLIALKETKEQLLILDKEVNIWNPSINFYNILSDEKIWEIKAKQENQENQIKWFYLHNNILKNQIDQYKIKIDNININIKQSCEKKINNIFNIIIWIIILLIIIFIWFVIPDFTNRIQSMFETNIAKTIISVIMIWINFTKISPKDFIINKFSKRKDVLITRCIIQKKKKLKI